MQASTAPSSSRHIMRVLHVTECFSTGVSRAMISRIRALPNVEHHLLYSGDDSPKESDWTSITRLPAGGLQRIRSIRLLCASLLPDIIHAHSSWAGVYTRVAHLKLPIIYEPHCFKFLDPNLSRTHRWLFRTAESALAHYTSAFGLENPSEKAQADQLSKNTPSFLIPNIPSQSVIASPPIPTQVTRITSMGRLAAQKDPDFFAEAIRLVHRTYPNVEAIWIGDGENKYRERLRNAGIEVVGHLEGADVRKALQNTLYVHTASYEGFSIAVLDAAAIGCPIVSRRIASNEHTALRLVDSPQELAESIITMIENPNELKEAFVSAQKLLTSQTEEALRTALLALYGSVREKGLTHE